MLDLNKEPKPESLWWTNAYKDEDVCRGETWDVSFVEEFDLLGYRFRRNGKGIQGNQRKDTKKKSLGCWWWDGHVYRAESVSLTSWEMRAKWRKMETILV